MFHGPDIGPEIDLVRRNRMTLAVPRYEGNLYAFEPKTRAKELVFSTNKETKWFTSPPIVNDVAYFVDFDSVLYAVDLETRQPVWTFEADGAISRAPLAETLTMRIGKRVPSLNVATPRHRTSLRG